MASRMSKMIRVNCNEEETHHEAGNEAVEGGVVIETSLGQKEEVFAHQRHLVAV
jgi:hypothetical protein